jgi:hypothetical protein
LQTGMIKTLAARKGWKSTKLLEEEDTSMCDDPLSHYARTKLPRAIPTSFLTERIQGLPGVMSVLKTQDMLDDIHATHRQEHMWM